MQRPIDGHLRERQKILAQASNRNRVHFHGVESHRKSSFDSIEGLMQLTAAGNKAKLLGVKRVERNVHARKTREFQFVGIFRQKHAIRRQRHVINARRARYLSNETNHALAHQRLAARQTKTFHPHACGHTHHACDFLKT